MTFDQQPSTEVVNPTLKPLSDKLKSGYTHENYNVPKIIENNLKRHINNADEFVTKLIEKDNYPLRSCNQGTINSGCFWNNKY